MGLLGHILISNTTLQALDRSDLEAALFEHSGIYMPTFWEWLTIPFLGEYEYDNHWTKCQDRNGVRFSIVTTDRDPVDGGRATYVFQDHEMPRF